MTKDLLLKAAESLFGLIVPGKESAARALVSLPVLTFKQRHYLWTVIKRYEFSLRMIGVKLPVEPQPPIILPAEPYFIDFANGKFLLRLSDAHAEHIHMVPKARYDKKSGLYSVPYRMYPVLQLHKFAKQTEIFCTESARTAVEAMYVEMRQRDKASRAHDADIDMKGFGLALDPFQRAGIKGAVAFKRGWIADSMGLGKCQAVDTKVLTPVGWREIGTIEVGDRVIGSSGSPVRVLGVYPQGMKTIYRLMFSDGSSTEACDDHLWTMRYRRGGRDLVDIALTTKQLRERPFLNGLNLAKATLYLPMLAAPVEFQPLPLPMPPYLLGQLIANGSLSGESAVLTINTSDTDDILERIAPGRIEGRGGATVLAIHGAMPVVRTLELDVKSREKRIPQIYKQASPNDRIALLQGLMDGDGSISKTKNKICYHTIALPLAQDVQELVECLGGIASVRTYDRTPEGKPIEYQVRMRLPEWVLPFFVRRKAERYKPGRLARPCRTLIEVTHSREADSVCIAVEAADQLYATEQCILTHNTRQGLGVLWIAESFPAVAIVPASMPIKWQREAAQALVGKVIWRAKSKKAPTKHTCKQRQLSILDMQAFDRNCDACCFQQADLIIVNYDKLADGWKVQFDEDGQKIKGKKREKGERAEVKLSPIGAAIKSRGLRGAVIDESHYVKNEVSQRTKAVAEIIPGCSIRIALSGTPIKSRPSELISQAKILDRLDDLGGDDVFYRKFCQAADGNTSGSANEKELNQMLRATGFIQRSRRDVRKELPPIREGIIPVDLDNWEEYRRVEEDLINWCAEQAVMKTEFVKMLSRLDPLEQADAIERKMIETRMRTMRAQAMIRVGALKRVAAKGKLAAVIDWTKDFLASGEKLVLFVVHKNIREGIVDAFNALHICGADDLKARDLHGQIFQGQVGNFIGRNAQLIVCSDAGKEGIDLDAADHIGLVEQAWTDAEEAQKVARIDRHRVHKINAYRFIAEGTIENKIAIRLEEKRAICEAVTRGESNDTGASTASVFDDVFNDLAAMSTNKISSESAFAKAQVLLSSQQEDDELAQSIYAKTGGISTQNQSTNSYKHRA